MVTRILSFFRAGFLSSCVLIPALGGLGLSRLANGASHPGLKPGLKSGMAKRFTIESPGNAQLYETIVKLKYQVQCTNENQEESGEDQTLGVLNFQGRRTILNFYRYRNELEVSLGTAPLGPELATLELRPSSSCRLENLQSEVHYEDVSVTLENLQENPRQQMAKLALLYAPFVNYRENQYDESPSDVPLMLAYSVHSGKQNHQILRYTLVLSDEDSMSDSGKVNAQLARYGRTTDIEWVYEIEFDEQLKVVDERFQGILHFWYHFRGNYLPSPLGLRTHPILYNYNLGNNNVFMDTPFPWLSLIANPHQQNQPTGHLLVPRYRMDYPQSRERLMFAEPWMFKVSEAELKRQRKPSASVEDLLFVQIRGQLESGSLKGQLALPDGPALLSGGYPCDSLGCSVKKLGNDLWYREGFTSIPVGIGRLDSLAQGSLSGKFKIPKARDRVLDLKKLRFFRLRDVGSTFQVEDLTQRFSCRLFGQEPECSF